MTDDVGPKKDQRAQMVFLASVLVIYGLMNFYVLRRGWQALAGTGAARTVFVAAMIGFASFLFIGRVVGARRPGGVAEFVTAVGYVYLGALTILLCLVAAVDLLRLINAFVRVFPASFETHPQSAARAAFFAVAAVAAGLLVFGATRAYQPRVRSYEIEIPKSAGSLTGLECVVVSDLHFGPLIRSGYLEKISGMVRELAPDVLFFPGDIMTEELPPREQEKILGLFRGITAKFGSFAVFGNHEAYGERAKNIRLFEQAGIRLLQNEAVLVAGAFYVAGRNDESFLIRGEHRRPLDEILADADKRRPIFLLEHQPMNLSLAENAGVDLEIAGHTHGGQMFPLTLINKLIYEKDKGAYRRGATHYDISQGAGFWGPPFRIGSRSEIVRIQIRFKG
jgi:predicted MPP superfamily phosphohydrolase